LNSILLYDAVAERYSMRILIVLILLIAALGLLILYSGSYLVVNDPEKSDAIVVLWGEDPDVRYARGLELLRAGYGRYLIVDAGAGGIYGRPYADLARDFIDRTAGGNAPQTSLCVISGASTKAEALELGRCLARLQTPLHSVLLVSSDFHTRRALSIFRHRLPQYRWSAAAARDESFGLPWWKEREWAKTYLAEAEKLVWWELWDRWHN
jgi:uncharacterized SAM-binding protein YcdF (DUF218 family)